MDLMLVLAVGIAMLVGVFGTVFPLVPGLPIVWGAALVYGFVAGFDRFGWVCFGLITAIFLAGMVAGILLPKRHLSAAGAPRSTMLAGLALGIIGFFVVPIIGLPLGAAVGVWLGEKTRLGDSGAAWRSTRAVLIGFGTGALAQLGAGVAMMCVWAAWALLD